LHFATHGLVAGALKGVAEPALMLTPPAAPSEEDDGLLTASEVMQLKLDAEWVVLSACNTAAGGAEGAEAMSGLARAFFYAGARALLVSHWEVESDAAVALTTKALAEFQADPRVGRAEALRRSMLALASDKGNVGNAHPSVWAPFLLVGEGAR
jgi:CHAT domain-containing protein